ncbi:MAG: hypothetical protein JEZ08_15160 [Clostridiales bacterium]|nr:hypothetical protein [Clostridiales bacterium]
MKYTELVRTFRKWGVMKRIIGIVLFCLIAFGSVQIVEYIKENQLTESEKALKEYFDDEGHVISILMPEFYYYGNRNYGDIQSIANIITMKEFDYDDKVTIKIIDLDVETRDEYLREKNLLLSSDNGPTLIMVDLEVESIDEYLDYGIALEVSDKLENYDNIYEFLRDGYYVALGMFSIGTLIDTDVIEEMGAEVPDANWTKEDFYSLQAKWFESNQVYIEYFEFERVYNYHFMDAEFIDVTGVVRFNTEENVDKIMAIRDRFISADYEQYGQLELTQLQNILNLNFDDAWEWNSYLIRLNSYNNFVLTESINALHPYSTYHPLLYRPVKLLPTVHRGENNVSDLGFIVNRKGNNLEYGLDFLDLLISDKYQFYIYEKKLFNGLSPSVSTLEEEIKNKHPRQVGNVEKKVAPFAFETRDALIASLLDGTKKVQRKSRETIILEDSFREFVVEMSFNEKYFTREEIEEKLRKFEREVYLKLNE